MLTLPASTVLAGDADAATSVTLTVFGQTLDGTVISSSTTENYKILYQGQLPAAAATLYTVTAGKTDNIKTIFAVNTDVANARMFQLFVGGTAASNAITPLLTIPAGGQAVYEDGRGWQMYNSTGQVLTSIYSAIMAEGNYGITGSKGETIRRELCNEANLAAPASGTLILQAIWLKAGTVVSNISMHSATTGATTPTNYLFGLYDINRNLLATSANQTTAAWAANTIKTLAMTATYTVPTDGIYYIGYFMTATTLPTLKGQTARTTSQLAGQAPILQGTSTAALTTALPNPAAAITVNTLGYWAAVT